MGTQLGQKEWVKGQSGNPKGRPKKGLSLSEHIDRALHRRDPVTKKARSELVAEVILAMALQGNLAAIDRVLDRTEGKVADQTNANVQQTTKVVVVFGDDEDDDYPDRRRDAD